MRIEDCNQFRTEGYEITYNLIKSKGPITIDCLAVLLAQKYNCSLADFNLYAHSMLAAFLANLSKHKFIGKVPQTQSFLRKTQQKRPVWKISSKTNAS